MQVKKPPPKKEEKVDLGPMLGEDGKEMVIGKDEALDGVKFVRHERKAPNGENLEKGAHTTARLKLDDAVARANAVMEAQMKAREEKRKAKSRKGAKKDRGGTFMTLGALEKSLAKS